MKSTSNSDKRKLSISPAIVHIETPVDQSLPEDREKELLKLIEKHRPARLTELMERMRARGTEQLQQLQQLQRI